MPTNSNPLLSILIVNYKSAEALEACLLSAQKALGANSFEAVVVNNSQEDLSYLKEKLDQPRLQIIEADNNLGFAKGCNMASQYAHGEILWILNPDTKIVAFDLQHILSLKNEKQNTGIIGCRIENDEGKVHPWTAGIDTGLIDIIRNNIGMPRSKACWEATTVQSVEWVTGASFFITRDLYKQLRGFDENFFMYFEDMDLCRRVRQIGRKVIRNPLIRVRHTGGVSFGKNRQRQKQYYYNSQSVYFKKHFSPFEFYTLKLLRILIHWQ